MTGYKHPFIPEISSCTTDSYSIHSKQLAASICIQKANDWHLEKKYSYQTHKIFSFAQKTYLLVLLKLGNIFSRFFPTVLNY